MRQKIIKEVRLIKLMEICDKCGKTIGLREKCVLNGEWEGIYHDECADEILEED